MAAATVGSPCEEVDRVGRRIIAAAGYGEYFVHRIGHGIGMEAHEDPYMVEGNTRPLAAGNAFSVEPGIYVPGRWGMRLEDIVVATADGPEAAQHVRPRPRRRLSRATQSGCSNCVSSGVGEYSVSSIDRSAASRRASGPASSAQ